MSSAPRPSVRLLLLVTGVGVSGAVAAPLQGQAMSRQEFFAADPEVVRKLWNARELDVNRPFDRRVLNVMTKVQNAARVSAQVFWKTPGGSQTHPRLGIGLDSLELRRMESEGDSASFEADLVLVLGHELAHVAQSRIYAVDQLGDTAKARAIETQADILTGMTVMWVALMDHLDSAQSNALSTHAQTRLASLGSHDYDQSHHPGPAQRARAFGTGLNAGLQLMDLRSCDQGDANACSRVQQGKKNAEIADLTEKDFWPWSNRLAKRIAQYVEKEK